MGAGATENKYIEADVTITDTGDQNVSGMNFTVEPSKKYAFSFSGIMKSQASNGLKLGLAVPVDAVLTAIVTGNTTDIGTFENERLILDERKASTVFSKVAAGELQFTVEGYVEIDSGGGGTIQLIAEKQGTGYIKFLAGSGGYCTEV